MTFRYLRLGFLFSCATGAFACGGSVVGTNGGGPVDVGPDASRVDGSVSDAATTGDVAAIPHLPDAGPHDAAIGPHDGAIGPEAGAIGIECGNTTCAAPEWCLICDPGGPASTTACHNTQFPPGCEGEYPMLRMSCDGQEDCESGEHCQVFEGSLGTYARCMPNEIGNILCRALGDCPPGATSCEAHYPAPGYPVRVCR